MLLRQLLLIRPFPSDSVPIRHNKFQGVIQATTPLYLTDPLDPGFPGNFPAPLPPKALIAAANPPLTNTAAKPVRPRENRRSRIVDTSVLLTAIRSPFQLISLPSCWRTRVIDNTTDAPVS